MVYTPSNWYWIVAGSTTQVWSSARLGHFPTSDETCRAWPSAGNVPASIDSPASPASVMFQQAVPALQASRVPVVSTGTPALNASYAIDPISTGEVTSIVAGINAGKGLWRALSIGRRLLVGRSRSTRSGSKTWAMCS
jgi:hypothetical protein